jgi:hypothetical protein
LTQELVVKSWLKRSCFVCAALFALGLLAAIVLGGTFLVQQLSVRPEKKQLVQQAPPAGSAPGRIVLSLSSAAVTVKAGPAGGPIRVESDFDPGVHWLEQDYDEDGTGGWTYRLDFHEKRLLHVSVVSIWLGKRSPEVMVEIPRDLPLALEMKMEGGYVDLDLAGMELTTANIELDRGVLGVIVSEPLRVPMERLSLKGRMGTMVLRSLGNASPEELHMQHGIGAVHVDLGGRWQRDADVDLRVMFGNGALELPRGVSIEGLDGAPMRLLHAADEEIPAPTLRVATHSNMGEIRIAD